VDSANGEIIVSRELLASLLENLETQVDHNPLSPHQRESLVQLAMAVLSGEQIVISRELLEELHTVG
jgi:hypothetical protein